MNVPDDDPFAAWADPYPEDTRLDRRTLAKLALGSALLAAPLLAGCAHVPLGCRPAEAEATGCRHRFCRYYRAK